MSKKLIPFILIILLFISPAAALKDVDLEAQIEQVSEYLITAVSAPQVSSVGGEWAVISLARSGAQVPDGYFKKYYEALEQTLKASGGILHERKYTEYSRVVLALSAIGRDPSNVAGYDLLSKLLDVDKNTWQGVNGAAFALLALDSRNYPAAQAREEYISFLLENQLSDGGFSLDGKTADPDLTAMALQALAKYRDREDVSSAAERALACLSSMQKTDGGFESRGSNACESTVQVIVALNELGLGIEDERFIKNGNTLLDCLLSFRTEDGFSHTPDGQTNTMATEQALYALAGISRFSDGKAALYDMSDVSAATDDETAGLVGKHADVMPSPVSAPGKSFADVSDHPAVAAIYALAERGIINGKGSDLFDPDATMTRAEFAAVIVRGLGLDPKGEPRFTDVPADSWFFGYVSAATEYDIVNGVSQTSFAPQATITREQAAAMVCRAAALCGMTVDMADDAARDVLAQFEDYTRCGEWARVPLAFCYSTGILDSSVMNINPQQSVTRWEIAQMLYLLLDAAKLII